ncbi:MULTISPECIES: hypothetical protein [Bacillota]|uniref:hypothetical protein n=1 Tax=Bacillota TaxID=1239 RepID=UPI002431909C|nr:MULTISPECIES: hypothetical protein [Bacillota]
MKKENNEVIDFINVLKEKGMFVDGSQTSLDEPKEIQSSEEFVERFHELLVAISEPEHFIQMMELLTNMEIGGALVYTTGNEETRGLFISHVFSEVSYDEENYTVSFVYNDGNEDDYNASEFIIPVEEMQDVHGYISNEDDGEGVFYCLNIYLLYGNVNVVWNC